MPGRLPLLPVVDNFQSVCTLVNIQNQKNEALREREREKHGDQIGCCTLLDAKHVVVVVAVTG